MTAFKNTTIKMNNKTTISNMNIRATALEEFWGNAYPESIYLWEGAKHNLTLSEIDSLDIPTMPDLFVSNDSLDVAHEHCKELYLKFLPILSDMLNKIHNISMPVSFWRTAFGLWLFRSICITYEKYAYLSKVDINNTDIKLLDLRSFYIPHDHYDFFNCFTSDFGVQQLVSHYYHLFKRKDFPYIDMECVLNNDQKQIERNWKTDLTEYVYAGKALLANIYNLLTSKSKASQPESNPDIALCAVYFGSETYKSLVEKSNGRILNIDLPVLTIKNDTVDLVARNKLLGIESENEFEYYLIQTMVYCMPKMFIEHFMQYYLIAMQDVSQKRFTHIVSEGWISDMKASIYVAIAQNSGRKLIGYEHCVFFNIFKNNALWIEYDTVDYYLTTGWTGKGVNIIQGGFSGRDIRPYRFMENSSAILFISTVMPSYLHQFNNDCPSNSNYLKALRLVRDFIELLPASLFEYFTLRPRNEKGFWDTEHAWEVDKRNIRIDRGDFSESILNSKVIVIDHMSTGLSEILLMSAPVIIIHKEWYEQIAEEYEDIFEDLIKCGVVHRSAKSAIEHLTFIYSDVQLWWHSLAVQKAITTLLSKLLSPPAKTIDYLLSCLKENAA